MSVDQTLRSKQVALNEVGTLPDGVPTQLIEKGRIVAGNATNGYTVELLDDQNNVLETYTRVPIVGPQSVLFDDRFTGPRVLTQEVPQIIAVGCLSAFTS